MPLRRLSLSKEQKQKEVLTGHSRTVNSVRWHPTETFTLLSGSQDQNVKRWDVYVIWYPRLIMCCSLSPSPNCCLAILLSLLFFLLYTFPPEGRKRGVHIKKQFSLRKHRFLLFLRNKEVYRVHPIYALSFLKSVCFGHSFIHQIC